MSVCVMACQSVCQSVSMYIYNRERIERKRERERERERESECVSECVCERERPKIEDRSEGLVYNFEYLRRAAAEKRCDKKLSKVSAYYFSSS